MEVDDGGGSVVDGAVGFDDVIAAHAVQPRRARSGQDVYMLYTGGTTGMPKGVMYRQQDFAARQHLRPVRRHGPDPA